MRSANPSQSNNAEVAKLKAELAAVAHHDEVEKLKAELTAVNAKNKERARDHLLAAIAVPVLCMYMPWCSYLNSNIRSVECSRV